MFTTRDGPAVIDAKAPLYPHRTLWRYTNAVLLLLLLKADIGRKSRISLQLGCFQSEYNAIRFGMKKKLECYGYPIVKKV